MTKRKAQLVRSAGLIPRSCLPNLVVWLVVVGSLPHRRSPLLHRSAPRHSPPRHSPPHRRVPPHRSCRRTRLAAIEPASLPLNPSRHGTRTCHCLFLSSSSSSLSLPIVVGFKVASLIVKFVSWDNKGEMGKKGPQPWPNAPPGPPITWVPPCSSSPHQISLPTNRPHPSKKGRGLEWGGQTQFD